MTERPERLSRRLLERHVQVSMLGEHVADVLQWCFPGIDVLIPDSAWADSRAISIDLHSIGRLDLSRLVIACIKAGMTVDICSVHPKRSAQIRLVFHSAAYSMARFPTLEETLASFDKQWDKSLTDGYYKPSTYR